MVNIAVLGSNEFVVGFQLAGIRKVIESGSSVMEDIARIKSAGGVGIVIIDEHIMGSLEQHQREEIEDSVDPVFIPVSAKVEQDSLKRLIKKSIGVDLWD